MISDFVPNHLLVLHIFLLFAVLNPFVVPFAVLYFFVQTGVMKNQVSRFPPNVRIAYITIVSFFKSSSMSIAKTTREMVKYC